MSIPSARLRTVAVALYDIGAASRGAREARAARCVGWAHGLAGVRRRGAGRKRREEGRDDGGGRRAVVRWCLLAIPRCRREDELGRDVLPQRAHKLRHLAAAVAAGGKGGREGAAGEARGEERRGKGEGGGARRKYRCGRVGAEGSGALPAAEATRRKGASAAAREEVRGGGRTRPGRCGQRVWSRCCCCCGGRRWSYWGVAAGEGGFLVEEERAEL
ncbi:hypothetical protein DFH09DRAFT_1108043, partial [Mycena vulgaris]